ncbi:MAG: DNA cytosine methyltransferase [Paludibacteraceae bacterium]|nr:DNA cytosine methyltransferase [Paludibacteraceae bacterium]
MPEIKLTREEIFGGRLIVPMRQWLKKQGRDTQNYPYNDDMAIITHYLQNKNIEAYREQAISKMKDYYRALHSLDAGAPVPDNEAEVIFEDWDQSKLCQKYKDNDSFTFVDLFAGIGGFRIALEELGGRCVYASEFNTTAQKSYGLNHGVIPFGDITKPENKALIPEGVDVLCAGFPCQPFSMAGKRLGFADEAKGTLFYHLQEIIAAKRPRVIFLENVMGLMSIRNQQVEGQKIEVRTIDTILRILRQDLGYYVPDPKIINAKDFGVPQNRDRVFIVGFDMRGENEYVYPNGEGIPDCHFGDIREQGVVAAGYYMSNRYWQTLVRHKEAQKNKGRGYGYRIIDDNDFGHTLMVGGMGLERNLVIDPNNPFVETVIDPRGELNHENIRVLTERECARMQGFPEEFEIYVGKSPAYNQFGNSVAVPAIKEVARTLLDYRGINHRSLL